MPTNNLSKTSNKLPEDGIVLNDLSPGQCGCICQVAAESTEIERLKAMGVCEGRQVQVVRTGDPLILMVLGTRIGLSARLAEHIWMNDCTDVEGQAL